MILIYRAKNRQHGKDTETLLEASNELCTKTNAEKTTCMFMIHCKNARQYYKHS